MKYEEGKIIYVRAQYQAYAQFCMTNHSLCEFVVGETN
jgi:hypothetical protein